MGRAGRPATVEGFCAGQGRRFGQDPRVGGGDLWGSKRNDRGICAALCAQQAGESERGLVSGTPVLRRKRNASLHVPPGGNGEYLYSRGNAGGGDGVLVGSK